MSYRTEEQEHGEDAHGGLIDRPPTLQLILRPTSSQWDPSKTSVRVDCVLSLTGVATSTRWKSGVGMAVTVPFGRATIGRSGPA